ncbi:uncharacterized protein YukE [Actinopolyspora biskrensis]|uniref:Uncharacterized protein YukE n=1 Tax=Actinopolyspora biskrensis TaxID=1470178 RepID=A0A852Z8P7_9ACTN|nr:hypothetical protein [Actinopolyspora biskrensis]NYH78857.1 uncharacterized protein YukE [Actinopolyspora biskrensis]
MSNSPAGQLVEPTSTDPIPDLAENVIGVPQYISLSYWIGWAAEQVCGTNPWLWIGEQVGGDWEKVQRAGVALENLKEFNGDFASELKSAFDDVSHDWSGVAADNAESYFRKLSETIKQQQDTLDDLATQFKDMAIGMYESANAIKGFLEMLLDYLIAIGLEAAAAAASSYTVIGPVLSGAAMVATITKAIGVWGQALDAHTAAWNSVQATVGLVAGYASSLQDIDRHSLPEGNYDHPGV